MSSPDTTPFDSKVKMTNPPSGQTKMVRIKAIHACRVGTREEEHIIKPGEEAMVTEEQAKEFCDNRIEIGHRSFAGLKLGATPPQDYVTRAERVEKKT